MPWRRRRRGPSKPPDLPTPTDNVSYNRRLWDWYADAWSDPEFRRRYSDRGSADPGSLEHLGDEWGREGDVDVIVTEFIDPYIGSDSVVGEIGVGGGRVAVRIVDRVKELHCFDISPNMLDRARRALAGRDHVRFMLLDGPSFSPSLRGRFDFVYSFDVFVHLDLHTMWRYVQEISGLLKSEGRSFLHTSNLTAPEGWKNFASQDTFTVEGHYPVTPEVIRTLVSHTDLGIVKDSTPRTGNLYLERDYLVVLEKPG